MWFSIPRLGRMRAHNRLESRYSSSSGGSYDEDKSEYLYETHKKNGAGVIFWWVWNKQAKIGVCGGNQDSVTGNAWAVCRMAFGV